MSGSGHREREISRRTFLAMGGALAAGASLGPLLDPLEALGAAPRWPSGRLGALDAVRVNAREFMPLGQFRRWHAALDRLGPSNQRGLRAAASPAHEGYIDDLLEDFARAGIRTARAEELELDRWTTRSWALAIAEGSAAGPVRTASYIPYSGQTPPQGITAQLAYVEPGATPAPGSLAGRIAVFDVAALGLTYGMFSLLEYGGGSRWDPRGQLADDHLYKRPYLGSIAAVNKAIEELTAAGAVGIVGVIDQPANGADGSYFPYEGIIHALPGVYVDREVGATLKEQARAGLRATLTLPAEVRRVRTRNILATIPGRTDEIVTLHCHTDGTNAIEDNGPMAIVAMAQYLARLPQTALPSTIQILLTSGHFVGGKGVRAYLERHRDDLVRRTKAALTIEHLGLKEWDELPGGRMGPTGRFEAAAVFTKPSQALVDASLTAFRRQRTSPGAVLKPLNPNGTGGTNDPVWPGEGQYLQSIGGIPTANFITGPTYLLNWGISTTDKVDFPLVRRQAMAFTEMVLALGRVPRARFEASDAS